MTRIRLTIDDLEVLTPDQLGELLRGEVWKDSPDVRFIQDLLTVGCPIDARGEWGQTALHWAAKNGHLAAVKFLISKGALVDDRDEHSQTPLHYAACDGSIEVVKFLLSKGADIHARSIAVLSAWDIATAKIKEAIPKLRPK